MTKQYCAGLIAVGVLLPLEAMAFVCSRTTTSENPAESSGPALAWGMRNIRYTMHEDGTNTMPGPREFTELRSAFDPWENALGCPTTPYSGMTTDLSLQWDGNLSTIDVVGFDFLRYDENQNLLIFRDLEWPHAGQGQLVIALTTATFSVRTGQILDADIEFNSATNDFYVVGEAGDNGNHDLLNTAVHEVGHFLGLAHSNGVATMAPTASAGETEKRDLDCDDISGILFKYPAGSPNGYCTGAVTASCGNCQEPDEVTVNVEKSVVGFSRDGSCAQSGPLIWLFMGLALVLGSRKRRN